MLDNKKIIILTPVKNEEKFLPYFIELWSHVCDYFIFLLEPSTDNSEEIIKKYKNVILINHEIESYNEQKRAELLVNEARRTFGLGNILLAVDADEFPILNQNSLDVWETIKRLPIGTTVTLMKPDLLPGAKQILNKPEWAIPLVYVDDGSSYSATKIHTTRVPVSKLEEKNYKPNIPILYHFNLLRKDAYFSRRRYYCCVEKLLKTSRWYKRCARYSINSKDNPLNDIPEKYLIPVSDSMNDYLSLDKINISYLCDEGPFWQDYELLKLINNNGFWNFIFEPIWQCPKNNKFILSSINASINKRNAVMLICKSYSFIYLTSLICLMSIKLIYKFRGILWRAIKSQ
jgi:hypothetical protein